MHKFSLKMVWDAPKHVGKYGIYSVHLVGVIEGTSEDLKLNSYVAEM